jgi:hypothetical protein
MSGYRGLAMTSGWAVVQDGGGLRRLSLPFRAENRPRSYWPKEPHTWRFADFASLASAGIAGEAAYRVWFPQPTLDR